MRWEGRLWWDWVACTMMSNDVRGALPHCVTVSQWKRMPLYPVILTVVKCTHCHALLMNPATDIWERRICWPNL